MDFFEKFSLPLAFLTAFLITYFSIPALIRLSLVKRLYDEPDHRKLHARRTSSLGGVAIFGGLIFSFVFYSYYLPNPQLNSVLASLIILFVTGVKDDLYPMVPFKKILGQLLAVGIIIFQGDVRLTSLYGIAGIWEMPYYWSVILSSIFYLGIINSFNFIDGINGLSASIATIMSLAYSYWFWYSGETLFVILCLCIVGSLLAFLRYNIVNARIFMGDSGSMVIGFFGAMLTINFLKTNAQLPDSHSYFLHLAAMVFAFGVLIIPLFDTARVILIRVFIKKTSPFAADRNHIHHVLLDIGHSHLSATMLLASANIIFIALIWFLNPYFRAKVIFAGIFLLALLLSQIPFLIKQRQKRLGTYRPATSGE